MTRITQSKLSTAIFIASDEAKTIHHPIEEQTVAELGLTPEQLDNFQDVVEMLFEIQIHDETFTACKTLGDIVALVERQPEV